MKHIALLLLVFVFSGALFAQQDQKLNTGKWAYYGAEFYLNLSSGKTFNRETLEKILNGSHVSMKGKFDLIQAPCEGSNCYKHVVVGYDSARKIMFGELDIQKDNNGSFVIDVYCGKKFYFRDLEEVSTMHDKVNIEHTWPQSKFNSKFPKEMQKSDMHHLYLTDSHANSVRGNTPFGFVNMNFNRMDTEGCDNSYLGFTDFAEVYTPPAPHRGNVARALFYFSMHYNLPISKKEEDSLRKWHKLDPVDAAEIKRHEAIAKHQKVRNPFVDHPELVDRVIDF
jgi:endonuclease I